MISETVIRPMPSVGRSFSDSGVVLRALEVAVAQLRWLKPDLQRFSQFGTSNLYELSLKLAQCTGAITRVRRLTWDGLRQLSDAGGAAMVPVNDGWLVVGPRKWVLLSSGQEQALASSSTQAPAWFSPEGHEGVVLELRLGLEALGQKFAGSPNPWARLASLLRLESTDLWAVLIYSVVLGAFSLAVPVAVQVLVNTIAVGALFQPLVVLSFILLAVLVVTGLVNLAHWYAVELLQRRLFVRVAEDLTRRLADYDGRVRDHYDTRELSNRFFEVVNLQKTLGRLLLDGLGVALQMLVSMLLLAFYHPYLFVFDVVLILTLVAVVWAGRGAVSSAIVESEAKYRVAGWLESVADKPGAFGWKGGSLFAAIKADVLVREYLTARRQHYRFVFRQLIGGVGIQIFALVVLMGLGGWLVMKGELTLGQLVAAELVVGAMGSGFAKAGKHFEAAYDLLAGLDKLGKVVDLADGSANRATLSTQARPHLHVSGLTVERDERKLFDNLGFRLPAGARVAVVGADGAGKTSLLEVLAGLRQPSAGVVNIGGFESTRENYFQLRSLGFLVRPQDVAVGSVFDNLRMGNLALTEDGAWQALEKVHLREVVAQLPEGLATPLLGHGAPLSSSHLARLCLARAYVASPSVLLCDGALDELALSEEVTEDLLNTFLGPAAPWTALVVSRDRRVLEKCPATLSLPEGAIS